MRQENNPLHNHLDALASQIMPNRRPQRPQQERDPEQSKRFIEAARELGCDDDEDALKARMKRLAESKPAPLKSIAKRPREVKDTEKTDDAGSNPAASTKTTKGV